MQCTYLVEVAFVGNPSSVGIRNWDSIDFNSHVILLFYFELGATGGAGTASSFAGIAAAIGAGWFDGSPNLSLWLWFSFGVSHCREKKRGREREGFGVYEEMHVVVVSTLIAPWAAICGPVYYFLSDLTFFAGHPAPVLKWQNCLYSTIPSPPMPFFVFVFLLRFLCWCLLLVHVPLLVLVPLPLSPLVLVPLRLPLCTSSFTSGVHWWLGAEESLNPIPTVMNKSTIKIPGELYICVLINHEWIDPVP